MKAFLLNNQKDFIHTFFLSDIFDHFLLTEAIVQNNFTTHIDGKSTKPESDFSYMPWKMIKSFCSTLIKGSTLPQSFRFVMHMAKDDVSTLLASSGLSYTPSDIESLSINIIYKDGQMSLISGLSMTSFYLSKDLPTYWDSFIEQFLIRQSIDFDYL